MTIMLVSLVKTILQTHKVLFKYYYFMPVQTIRRKAMPYRPNSAIHHKKSYANSRPNTGIHHRLEILNFDRPSKEEVYDDDIVFEDIEDLEGDFSKVGEVYDDHEREKLLKRKQAAFNTTKKKCFKTEKQPNLLTWAEKEQIRYLNNESSEEWPAERLATCFPATEDIIKKILNSKWKPQDLKALERHDERVKLNWKLLKDGKLKFDPYLQAHVSKFTERRYILPRPDVANLFKSMKVKIRKPGQKNEFVNIIESYNELVKKNSKEQSEKEENNEETKSEAMEEMPNELSEPPKGDSYVLEGPSIRPRQKLITLGAYKEKYLQDEILTSASNGRTNGIEHNANIHHSGSVSTTAEDPSVKLAKLSESEEEVDDKILMRIKIPRNKWIKGKTYKYGDCFYDDDGEFLYRVPGLTDISVI